MSRGRDSDSEDEVKAERSSKRAKRSNQVNGNGRSAYTDKEVEVLVEGDEVIVEEDEVTVEADDEMNTIDPNFNLAVDDDGFVEGSIVKITLTNFVTYDYCEIFPGPQMNMIVGPNGTGKSTIVCAIALGLGGPPSLLGRAKNIAEFVKTGEEEATIAIELKKAGVRNVVIQRIFRKSDNQNTWRINGKVETQREVLQTVRKLNIQVDNLCQFLPQDRVAEFAELSPSQLLERTQSATGETELHGMQQKLMAWREEEKSLQKTVHSTKDELKTMINRNAELEKDVLKMQQRDAIQRQIKLLKAQIPLVKYSDAKKAVDTLKTKALESRQVVDSVERELAPIQSTIDESEAKVKELSRQQAEESRNFKDQLQQLKSIENQLQKEREEFKTFNLEIKNVEKKIPERQREIELLKSRIERLSEEIKEVPSGDVSHLEASITKINHEANDIHQKMVEFERKVKETNSEKYRVEQDLKSKRREMENMSNIMKMRMNKLSTNFPEVYTAYQYCRQNPDKFEGKIHGPVAIAINVKDARYNDMIENAMGGSKSQTLKYFICEYQEDYRTFTRILIDEQRLKLNVTWLGQVTENDRRSTCTEDELRNRYKMDYFASDLLVGDKMVIDYLCKDKKLHLFPVALKRSHEEELVNHSPFQKFCIGNTYYNVKTSPYGRRSKQTSTSFVRQAEYFGDTVDPVARGQLNEEMRTLEGKIQQADIIVKEYSIQHDHYKQKLSEIKHQKEDYQSQKRDIQMAVQTHRRKVDKLEQFKEELQQAMKSPEELLKQVEKLRAKAQQSKEKEEQHLKNYIVVLSTFVDLYQSRNLIKLENIYANGKLTSIRNYFKTQTGRLTEAKAALTEAKKQYSLATREAQIHKRACENAGADLDDEVREEFSEILRKWKEEGALETEDVLLRRIADEEGKFAGIRFSFPGAMNTYEARKKEIERKQLKVEEAEQMMQRLKDKMTELRSVWEPRIDHLVRRISEKFSEAFNDINCTGEVAVHKEDDYDKWGINISVKFRENESLQLLTGQRQSGGERSVTTVLYLMSLQNLAKSPFRVVDEINQGMDPKNERMIHKQIVLGASKPGTSQYFLITPKLLPDLFYNERMRVLCIYNSEWLPHKIQPLTNYLENAQATRVRN